MCVCLCRGGWWTNQEQRFIRLFPVLLVGISKLFPLRAMCVCAKSLESCPTLCDPMDHSLPGSSVCGILQARILEWVAISSSRGSSQPRDQTASLVSPASAGRFFTTSATWTLWAQVNHRHQVQIIYPDTEQVFALIISSHLILNLIREVSSLSLFGKEIGIESLVC